MVNITYNEFGATVKQKPIIAGISHITVPSFGHSYLAVTDDMGFLKEFPYIQMQISMSN